MKKYLLTIFLLFLASIKTVSAQSFYADFWYDFWYYPYPYFLYESSFGFFLLMASLLALILAPLLQKYVPAFKDNKRAGALTGVIMALIVAGTTPFALWLQQLLLLSIELLSFVLFLLIIWFAWVILYKGWSSGQEQVNKSATSLRSTEKPRIEAEDEVDKARDISIRDRLERAEKREALRELSKIKKDARKENLKALGNDLERLGETLRKEYRIVKATNRVKDRVEGALDKVLQHKRKKIGGKGRRLISELEHIGDRIRSDQHNIDAGFGRIWEDFKNLERFGNDEERDKAARLAKSMAVEVKQIDKEIKDLNSQERKFVKKYGQVREHLENKGIRI